MNDYSWVTNEMFQDTLADVIQYENILAIPGIYEILAEEYNNEVLEQLEKERV